MKYVLPKRARCLERRFKVLNERQKMRACLLKMKVQTNENLVFGDRVQKKGNTTRSPKTRPSNSFIPELTSFLPLSTLKDPSVRLPPLSPSLSVLSPLFFPPPTQKKEGEKAPQKGWGENTLCFLYGT